MTQPNIRVLVAIVHDVLNHQRFDRRDELIATVKDVCANLPGVLYDGASVETAIIRVEHGGRRRDVPQWPGPPTAPANLPAGRDRFIIERAEAADLLARLQRKTKTTGPRTMSAGRGAE